MWIHFVFLLTRTTQLNHVIYGNQINLLGWTGAASGVAEKFVAYDATKNLTKSGWIFIEPLNISNLASIVLYNDNYMNSRAKGGDTRTIKWRKHNIFI